jgi:hypothetical protein
MREPLKIFSLRLCKEQRVQAKTLVLLTHVEHAPTRISMAVTVAAPA